MAEVTSPEFKNLVHCIQGYCLLSSASNTGKDASSLLCMLHLQEARLAMWAKLSGLMDDKLSKKFLSADNGVNETLSRIILLTNNAGSDGRSKLEAVIEKKQSAHLDDVSTIHLQYVRQKHIKVLKRAGHLQRDNRLPKSLRWTNMDTASFEKLVYTLATYNSRLYESLDSSQKQSMREDLQLMKLLLISSAKDAHEISDIRHALTIAHASDVANEKLAALKDVIFSLERDESVFNLSGGVGHSPHPNHPQRAAYEAPRLNILLLGLAGKHTPSLAQYDGHPVYLEWESYSNKARRPAETIIFTRMYNLAALLHAPRPSTMCILQCKGYIDDVSRGRYFFIFDIPGRPPLLSLSPPPPRTLLDYLKSSYTPSVNARVLLARALANCVLQLLVVNWTHGNLRSENILFFPLFSGDPPAFDKPYLGGFDYSHKDPDQPLESRFGKGKDIYSLGVMLLEIAKWRRIKVIESEIEIMKDVEYRMGRLYAGVVLRCLQSAPFGVVGPEAEVKMFFRRVILHLGRIIV